MSATPNRPLGRVLRTIVALTAGGWLVYQITTASFAGLAARSGDPRLLAISATPSHPDAASRWAQALLVAGRSADAARLARSVVRVDPTNDGAVRVLGLATEQLGDRAQGTRIMRQAASLGWRDTPTQLWVLRDAAVRDDAVTVIQRADALARRGRSSALTRGVFLAALNEPRLRAALAESLGSAPVWRPAFFADVRQRLPAQSAPGMAALLDGMRARGYAVTQAEWLNFIDRLVDLGQVTQARATWVQAFGISPDELATVPFDGDFTRVAERSSDVPASQFEWILNPDLAGAITFTGPRGTALAIPAEPMGHATILSQTLLLRPGAHALSSKVNGNAAMAAAAWTIACLPSGRAVPRRLPRGTDDEISAMSFDIPEQGCAAQKLTLRSRDRLGGQAVAIDRVRID